MNDLNERVLALIPARGGSKRLPGKNLLECGGRPLIAHTIAAALAVPTPLGHIVVSTDDEDIATVSRQLGAEVPFLRPAALATDLASSIDVALHALDWYHDEIGYDPYWLLLLQPTSPLRTTDDIESALALASRDACDSVIGVVPIRQGHPIHARRLIDGWLEPYVDEPSNSPSRPEAAYAVNGAIYLTRTEVIRRGSFYGKRSLPYIMPPERSIDVDESFDLDVASYLLAKSHGGA